MEGVDGNRATGQWSNKKETPRTTKITTTSTQSLVAAADDELDMIIFLIVITNMFKIRQTRQVFLNNVLLQVNVLLLIVNIVVADVWVCASF